jgi:hypothetical protein
MQGSLLIMCIVWTYRQRRLGIDDFGHPLDREVSVTLIFADGEGVPGLVAGEEDDPAAIRVALAAALESAAESDVRSGGVREVEELPIGEETPLLGSGKTHREGKGESSWSRWFR